MTENNLVTPDDRRAQRKKRIFKEIREWIVSIAIALLVVMLLRSFVFTLIRVDGKSMQPTLLNGERLFVTVYDVRFGNVERGDVVICHYPDRGNDYFVKRIVGVPGDSVYREDGVTHVVYTVQTDSGVEIRNEALDPDTFTSPYRFEPDYEPYVLDSDEYFVVGDNRYDSHDSRDWNDSDSSRDVGPITKDMITGHVRCVIWPLNSLRAVE